MLTRWLSKTEEEITGANLLLVLKGDSDTITATDTVAVPLISVLAGTQVQVMGMKLVTPFDGTGTGNLTVSVGDGGSATTLLAATQVALDDTEVLYSAGTGTRKVYLVDDTVDVFWDTTGVAITVYTTGELNLYLKVTNMNAWANR
jgi:hypothetical protein